MHLQHLLLFTLCIKNKSVFRQVGKFALWSSNTQMATKENSDCVLLANPCPNNEIFIVSERSINDSSFGQLRIFFFGCAAQLVGSQFPNQGSNPRPMAVKVGVLTTEPPANSWQVRIFFFFWQVRILRNI